MGQPTRIVLGVPFVRGSPAQFVDFRDGIDLRDDLHPSDTKGARSALNVHATLGGSLVQRFGWSTVGAGTSAPYHSLFAETPTATDYLIGVGTVGANSKVYKIDNLGNETDITGGVALNQTARWEWVVFPSSAQGPIFGMNGVDTPKTYSGTGNIADWTATSGTLPNGKYCVTWNNRIWVAGMSSYGTVSDASSALVWSEIGDAKAWPAANVTLFDPLDGDPITGLGVAGPYLLVFKRSKVWRVYDADTSANVKISSGIGCVAHRTICENAPPITEGARSGRATFFLSAQGVYLTDGQSVRPIGDRVRKLTDQVSPADAPKACGIAFNDRYYLSFLNGGVSANNRTVEYDLATGGWWLHDIAANQYASWMESGLPVLYGAHSASAKVAYAFDYRTTQDFSVDFDAYWTSQWMSWGTPYLRKRVRRVHMEGSGRAGLYVAKDYGALASFKADVFNSALSGTTVAEGNAYTLGTARAWSFQFKRLATDLGTPLRVDSFTPMLTMRRN